MRKLLSIFVMVCLSSFLIWAAMSWYLGKQAEIEFRQVLELQSNKLGEKPFRLELLDYNKNILGSSAAVRVSSDMPLLDDWIGDFNVTLKSLNGPIFITKKGIDFGLSRWFIRIDPDSFSAESLENIQNIFPQKLPTGILITGFDKESSFDSGFQSEWLDASLKVIYNRDTLSYRGSVDIAKLSYSSSNLSLRANQGTMRFQYPHIYESTITETIVDNNSRDKTISIQIPQLHIDSPILTKPIDTDFKGMSKVSFNETLMDANLNLELIRLKQNADQSNQEIPIDHLHITAQASGIQQSSFLEVMETKAELDNLQMQTQWELQENGELPEGQDKIWQLQHQIHRIQQRYPMSFYKVLFSVEDQKTNNHPTIEVQASNNSGQSTLKGRLLPSKDSGESTRFTDLLEAQANVTLDDLLYRYISARTVIRKKQFSLLYKHNKLLMQ